MPDPAALQKDAAAVPDAADEAFPVSTKERRAGRHRAASDWIAIEGKPVVISGGYMPRSQLPPGAKRKLIEFDAETWQALHTLALDRMNTIQELVEDAVADLLKKHNRPVTLKEALSASAGEQSGDHHKTKKRAGRSRARRAA
jgi:hypothetical protein